MQTIAILNQKGGVGKTTTAVNIGAGLALLDQKVLLIDLDPQANLTYSFGILAHDLENTVYELLTGDVELPDVIIKHGNLDIIPANLGLSGAEIEFSSLPGREFLLTERLGAVENYDYIIIDCSPSLGLLTLNALTSVSEVYITLQTEFLPMQGLAKLLETVDIVKKRLNRNLDITGIICTRYDSRKNLHNEVYEKIKKYFGNKVFSTVIRDNISLAEAPSFGQTIFEYRPRCRGALDYENLSKEILKRGKING